MKILIPSRSRSLTMLTPFQFPKKLKDHVRVYVAKEQKNDYVDANPELDIHSVSTLNDLIGKKVELMAHHVEDELLMLCDDDFTFFRRYNPSEPQLRVMEEDDWDVMIDQIENLFSSNSNLFGVGISMRQGNNRLPAEGAKNTRLNGCIVYRRSLFLSAEHDRVNPMADFDVILQLLRLGYDNHLISEFCYNQKGTNEPGGISDYRTLETQEKAAHKLADLHPGFVKIRQKKNKTGDPSLRERTEVTVYWKKARASAAR